MQGGWALSIKGGWEGVYFESIVVGANDGSTVPAANSPLWVKLGEDDRSPFEDTRVNQSNHPEVRYYQARNKYNNKPIGHYSDIVKVIAEIY